MSANALRWNGAAGHYEVYYLSATDRERGLGLWIRYTLRAPLHGPADCALWFMAMDREGMRFAHKTTHPIDALDVSRHPFHLRRHRRLVLLHLQSNKLHSQLVQRRLFRMVNDEYVHWTFRGLQLQPELLLHCRQACSPFVGWL